MEHEYDSLIYQAKIQQKIAEKFLSKNFSVPFLAKQMKCNERTLHRRCRKHCQKPPSEVIQEFRINIAKELVLDGIVSDIVAKQVGYRCTSAFLTAFKKEVGVSPQNYLLQLKKIDKVHDKNIVRKPKR
ncbi:helix-turn-helix domain-containing protein [Aliikangiella sp. IMCC44359]|uniref:helix-turn-helix domain-containing protein n=1 Tax=Aliikangiella sp. IMCC44359 TaxID=3459125 RepID=UPI00403AD945